MQQQLECKSSTLTTTSYVPAISSADVTTSATSSDAWEAVFQMLAKTDEGARQNTLTGYSKMVHDFAVLLEDHMQTIPEKNWHSFQIDCLNLVQSYRQTTKEPTASASTESP